MAVTLTCSLASGVVGPSPDENGMLSESIVISPSSTADADTGVYTCKFVVPNRVIVGGNLEYSISGQVVTFKATAAIDDSNSIAARIIGYTA